MCGVVAGVLAKPSPARPRRSRPTARRSPAGVDIATGFPTCSTPPGTAGPTGVVFDGQKLFVADLCNGLIYRFGPDGGTAATAEATSAAAVANGGLTIAGGRYYGTRVRLRLVLRAGDRGVRSGRAHADPHGQLHRQSARDHDGPADRRPLLRRGARSGAAHRDPDRGVAGRHALRDPGSGAYDGIAFTADGSRLYVTDYNSQHVLGLDRAGTVVFDVSLAGHAPDGIAVARPNTVIGGVDFSNNVFVNSNDGTIQRIDVNSPGNPVTVVGERRHPRRLHVRRRRRVLLRDAVRPRGEARAVHLPAGGQRRSRRRPGRLAGRRGGSARGVVLHGRDRGIATVRWRAGRSTSATARPAASGDGDPPATDRPHVRDGRHVHRDAHRARQGRARSASASVTTTVTRSRGRPPPAGLKSAAIIKLPSAKACVSRRRLRIRLVRPKGTALVSAVVLVNGKRVEDGQGRPDHGADQPEGPAEGPLHGEDHRDDGRRPQGHRPAPLPDLRR